MSDTYERARVAEGEVILTRTHTSEVPKSKVVEDLTESIADDQKMIAHLQSEVQRKQALLDTVNGITER